ncbi:hypothetical protein FKZ61_009880 [Litorilinea aerophila]|uniref:Uncharacterized protein n=1 Tax=Litorilinea aerophila TaxID=1204385 RepID=A0A540VGY0_9CHLR|nr:hypothetical protein [Litorilinea aerophila]MCC9076415.1 hypothetical protein [Litorilinea aerophila]
MKKSDTTWMEDPDEIIVLVNRTRNNYILELPAGRVRLDAGRRMRTLRAILKIPQIKALVDQGDLAVEEG